LTPPPHYVTVEHRMPGGGSALAADVRTMLDAMCAALDYAWGAVNLDLIVTDDGRVVPVEWGARLGGNGVAELLQLTTGVDATAWYVRMALGERASPVPRHRQHAGFRVLGVTRSGRLTAIEGLEEARSVPGIASVVVAARPGDTVAPYTRAGAKVGYLLASGSDREAVTASLDKADELIRFVVKEVP
jgi:biotin carboxylase